MKNIKIIIIATTIAILAVATIGVALAQNYRNPYFGGMMGYSTPRTNDNTTPYTDDDWWTEMQEHMQDHWNEVTDGDWWNEMREHMEDHWYQVKDQEWYTDMRAYMEEHLDEVENQPWFDEMIQFMEDRWASRGYGYRYADTPRSYGRGCWGW